MAEFRGLLELPQRGPCVYFIRKGRYLYIGETQQLVVMRWGSHFAEHGSFCDALRKVDPDLLETGDDVSFFVFYCDEIHKSCTRAKIRRTTQYLEHMLHVQAITHQKLGPRFALISDTKRTAPKVCDFAGIAGIADAIISHIASILD
jgi:hypothetical protein